LINPAESNAAADGRRTQGISLGQWLEHDQAGENCKTSGNLPEDMNGNRDLAGDSQ
jgi:hypothetical protein